MKKIVLLVSFLALTVPAAYADDFTSKLDLQLLSGTDIPVSGKLAEQYTYGYNIGLGLGYRVTDDLLVSAIYESHNLPSDFHESYYEYSYLVSVNELALQVKYLLPTGPVQPYVFAGAGAAFISANGNYYAYDNWQYHATGFLAEGGVGVNLPVNNQLSIFGQTKLSAVWWDKNLAEDWDVPTLDATLAYMPVQIGVDLHI